MTFGKILLNQRFICMQGIATVEGHAVETVPQEAELSAEDIRRKLKNKAHTTRRRLAKQRSRMEVCWLCLYWQTCATCAYRRRRPPARR